MIKIHVRINCRIGSIIAPARSSRSLYNVGGITTTHHVSRISASNKGCRAFPRLSADHRRRVTSSAANQDFICTPEPTTKILVAGATGGVGQLVCAKLLERGYSVKALSRSEEKTRNLLGNAPNLEVVYGDLRSPDTLKGVMDDVAAVCCCTGTTAFPSKRWDGGNNPEQTDYVAVKNLIEATPKSIHRFVLTTSAGVERSNQFPFIILNAFGVLKYKRMGEQVLEASGLPYTIIRPNRLTDGPYTSYDLNTLLQGVSGERQDVILTLKDDQVGETSRIAAAECIVQSLTAPETIMKVFSIGSQKGDGPGQDPEKWKTLFRILETNE